MSIYVDIGYKVTSTWLLHGIWRHQAENFKFYRRCDFFSFWLKIGYFWSYFVIEILGQARFEKRRLKTILKPEMSPNCYAFVFFIFCNN